MKRDFDDPASQISLKIGQGLDWIHGYKVFELKLSAGLDRWTDSGIEQMHIIDEGVSLSVKTATVVALALSYFF